MRALLVALTLLASPALAVQPDEILDDPELEARAREITKEVRCLVCRNESIDDSSASLARDLRLLVRERLVAGDTDAEVMTYLVDRYGEFVLLRPPLNAGNLLLWLSGPIFLLAGGAAAYIFVRNRANASQRVA
ncbi:MAG: cytochrome c-type biogenesis protein, partial [Pseudomonadota bacterium]